VSSGEPDDDELRRAEDRARADLQRLLGPEPYDWQRAQQEAVANLRQNLASYQRIDWAVLQAQLLRSVRISVRSFAQADWRGVMRRTAETYAASLRELQELASQIDWEQVIEVARIFDAQVQLADEERPASESASLADWLTSLPDPRQAGLLLAALTIVDRLRGIVEAATGEQLPAPVAASIELAMSIAAFLVLYIATKTDPPKDEARER